MKKAPSVRRENLRKDFWPNEEAWTGEIADRGWFRAPRTMLLIFALLNSSELSGKLDPSPVYLELLARHIDGGVIEMVGEDEHAFAAGFTGNRAVRSWRERMKILEEAGFIKSKEVGNKKYGIVLLIHPTLAVYQLRNNGKVPDNWWNAYRTRQGETKELLYEERRKLSEEENNTHLQEANEAAPLATSSA